MYFELKIPTQSDELTNDEFYEFCRQNKDLKFERASTGQIIFTLPKGGETGILNSTIITKLYSWNKIINPGVVFDSSTGFKLPNQATRSPDASWVKKERWEKLSSEEKKKFPPLCPDFVVEIRSENDTIVEIQNKMNEYFENGCQLGWIIDPVEQQVYIYQVGKEFEIISSFDEKINGGAVLTGFELDLNILK